MEDDPSPAGVSKPDQLRKNLDAWDLRYWFVFFFAIPLLLFAVFFLPQGFRSDYLVFSTTDTGRLQTLILSAYSHSQLFPHLVSNLLVYLLAMTAIFAFENRRQRFHLMAVTAFFLVPVICSLLTAVLWSLFGSATSMQGFSGIDAALFAYALLAGVTGFLNEKLESFGREGAFSGSGAQFFLVHALLGFMTGMIVFAGIVLGYFASTGPFVSNGIAHFGGFMTGLAVFLGYDLAHERRRGFDAMLGVSMAIGLAVYGLYLANVIAAVRGG